MDNAKRNARRARIRARMSGTAQMPRASVFRSNTRVTVQLIDDAGSNTVATASGPSPEDVGKALAEAAQKKGIKEIVFDRGGYKYHGQVKRLADSMRKAGLKF